MSATAKKAVKIGVEARVWYPLKQLCEKKGDLTDHIEKALKTYIALLDNSLVLKYPNPNYYELVDVNELELKDMVDCYFEPLYRTFPKHVLEKFVETLAPYIIKPQDRRPFRVQIKTPEGEKLRYNYDYLYPHVIADYVLEGNTVFLDFYNENEDPLNFNPLAFTQFKKDVIDIGIPPGFKNENEEDEEEIPLPEDPNLINDKRTKYVIVKVDPDLWDVFKGLVKKKMGDISLHFNEALKIYLGGLWNTLAIKEYYEFEYYPELKRRIVNIVYEDITHDYNTQYKPVGREEIAFTENAIKAFIIKLGRPYAYTDLLRGAPEFKKCDRLEIDDLVELVVYGYGLIYKFGEDKQLLLRNTSLSPCHFDIPF